MHTKVTELLTSYKASNKVNISTYPNINKLKANRSLRMQSYVAPKTKVAETYMVKKIMLLSENVNNFQYKLNDIWITFVKCICLLP